MNPQKAADRKCALCDHFTTQAKTDKPGDIEDAAKLAKAGIGRCKVLSSCGRVIYVSWDTVCVHFDLAPGQAKRQAWADKQMAKQQEAAA